MSETLTKGYHFFRLQVDVPPDGNLKLLVIQLCVEEVYYATKDGVTDYTTIKAKVPNSVKIIPIKSILELEQEYPGLVESIKLVQKVAIEQGLKFIEEVKTQPLTMEA